MTHTLRRGFHLAGSGLAVAGVVFVVMRLRSYGTEIDLDLFDSSMGAIIVLLSIVYGASSLLLALAWRETLQHFSTSVSVYWAIQTYGLSQIARYVPGNVFHLAGRQALGAASGVPQWPLAKSTLWELGLIALSGLGFSLLIIPLFSEHISITVALALFLLAQIVIAVLLKHYFGVRTALAFLCYSGFLLVSGTIFLALVGLLSTAQFDDNHIWFVIVGSFVFAWLVGLITPGAPAGLGVRELILLLLLDSTVGEPLLSLAVLAGRIVTATGDILFFLLALLMKLLPIRQH